MTAVGAGAVLRVVKLKWSLEDVNRSAAKRRKKREAHLFRITIDLSSGVLVGCENEEDVRRAIVNQIIEPARAWHQNEFHSVRQDAETENADKVPGLAEHLRGIQLAVAMEAGLDISETARAA